MVGTQGRRRRRPTSSSTALRDLGRHPRGARPARSGRSARWSTRPGRPRPSRESFVVHRPAEEGFSVAPRRRRRLAGRRPPGRAGGGHGRPHQRRGAGATCRTGSADWASTGRWPGPGPATATPCASAGRARVPRARPSTARSWPATQPQTLGGRSPAPVIVVVKVGTSSITDETGEMRPSPLLKLCAEIAAARAGRPRGRARLLGRHRRRAPGPRPRPPADRHRHPAGHRRGRPAPPDGAVLRDPRPPTASWPARCCSPRTTSSTAPSTSTPARRCAASSTSAWCRSSTRTTPWPTTRSATATTTAWPPSSPTWSAPTCSLLLTDTAGLFTADPRLDEAASLIEEIVEVDAALEAVAGGTRHRPGERRHGLQAGGGQDRRLVGGAGRHRRRRPCPTWCPARVAGRAGRHRRAAPGQAARRAASSGSPSPRASAGRVVVDDGARRALVESRPFAAARRGARRSRARFDVDDAGRGHRPRRPSLRQGPGPLRLRRPWPSWPGPAPATCPRARPTRSSTATTWWSCPP